MTGSVVLDTVQIQDSHTAENIGVPFLSITDKWGITDKVCYTLCAVTDNVSNIVAAIRHNKWNHLPCFAYNLNLITTNYLQDVPEVVALLQCCKHIVSYFHKNTKATDKLNPIQSHLNIDNHKLIQEVETRWNSSFYMLERIVEQEEVVRTALYLLNRNDLTIFDEEVEVIKGIIEVLQPFETVTREISAESYISV